MKSVSLFRGDVLKNPHGRFVALGTITMSPRGDLSSHANFRKLAPSEHPPEAKYESGSGFPWGWALFFFFLGKL